MRAHTPHLKQQSSCIPVVLLRQHHTCSAVTSARYSQVHAGHLRPVRSERRSRSTSYIKNGWTNFCYQARNREMLDMGLRRTRLTVAVA